MTSQSSVPPSASTAAVMSPPLGFGVAFADLYRREGLVRLDRAFLHFLQEGEPALRARLDHARANPDNLDRKAEAALLIEVAPWMEDFIARLFGIEKEVAELAARHHALAPLYSCKRQFVQRRAMNKVSDAEAASVDGLALEQVLSAEFQSPFSELAFANHVTNWLSDESANEERLKAALRYAAWALKTPEGRERNRDGVLFKAPAKLDFLNLLDTDSDSSAGYTVHRL
ncbi:MAG TPA: pyridine nucleotide-disulfide oxidoreductase, partial [Nitrosospira sp.]|nr:pyridine nucleotide-disulfide oxidoreductase [Nitrosospira sp.]